MKTILHWNKGFLNQDYKIYSNDTLVGTLKGQTWSRNAEAKINSRKLWFKVNGVFNQDIQIIDAENDLVIGTIKYNTWMTKATIDYPGGVANWKYNNFWCTKFCITDNEGKEINYHGSSSGGRIEFDNHNDLMILSGLYLLNYYWQKSVTLLLVILLPVWITIF